MEEQGKLFSLLEKHLMTPLGKMAQWKLVQAIMGAGIAAIPFTIVGSMFLVFNILPETFPVLESFFDATFFRFSDLYMLANGTTMGLLALYFNLALGYEYASILARDEDLDLSPLIGALLSMFAFFMSVPQLVFENGVMSRVNELSDDATIVEGWEIGFNGITRLGDVGIFTGIVMAVVAVSLYRLCVKRKWVIKLPDEVPSGVSRAFTALIPAFVVAFTVIFLNGVLFAFNTDIFQIVEVPFQFVTQITDSWLGILVIYFLVHALWLVGIHGANIIFPMLTPIMLGNMANNTAGGNAVLAGEFNNAFVTIGGSGATLALIIFMAYRTKSKQLSAVGKAALIPALFNINEPLIFGLPIIYNPYMAIPFFLAPMASATIAYFAIRLELILPVIAQMPWPTPVGLGSFISTGGDWRAIIVSLICVVVSGIIYYPFIKNYDKKLLQEEQGEAQEV